VRAVEDVMLTAAVAKERAAHRAAVGVQLTRSGSDAPPVVGLDAHVTTIGQ
jgi:hypothetical protein